MSAHDAWLLSGAPVPPSRLEGFLAAPVLPTRGHSARSGREVLEVLAPAMTDGLPVSTALLAAQRLPGAAAALAADMADVIDTGATLESAVRAFPTAFPRDIARTLGALTSAVPLSQALSATVPLAQAHSELHTATVRRRLEIGAIATAATLFAILATVLASSPMPGWGTAATHIAQFAALAATLYALAASAGARLFGRRGDGRVERLVDPDLSLARGLAMQSAFRVLGTLVGAGVPAHVALQAAAVGTADADLAADLGQAALDARDGMSLVDALGAHSEVAFAPALLGAVTGPSQGGALTSFCALGVRTTFRHALLPGALALTAWVATLLAAFSLI